MDGAGAVKVARRETARIYPGGDYQEVDESRPASPPTATDARERSGIGEAVSDPLESSTKRF
jgi:hypothetical protein